MGKVSINIVREFHMTEPGIALCGNGIGVCLPWRGLPRWLSGKESVFQSRKRMTHPCVGKMPWRRQWHYSILAWEIPPTEEPGGLQSVGSQRVVHDWACRRAPLPERDKIKGRRPLIFSVWSEPGRNWRKAGAQSTPEDPALLERFLCARVEEGRSAPGTTTPRRPARSALS